MSTPRHWKARTSRCQTAVDYGKRRNGTRHSVRKFQPGKRAHLFRFSTFSRNFPVGRTDKTMFHVCTYQLKQISIRFNLLHVFPSVPSFVFAESFIPSFNVLSGYYNVSLNMVAVPTAPGHSLHFGKFHDTARLTSSVKPVWFLKFYISSFFKPKYKI